MQRYESLDWLRGFCALAIMLYHVIGWELYHANSGSLLGVMGVYGVSIFFVLSGLSMAIVYHSYIKDIQTSLVFFIRRLFRLLPLLWVVISAAVAISFIFKNPIAAEKILLNITLLFGFVAPDQYINTGAWSIGNECVYYAFTPIFIWLYAKNKLWGNLAVIVTALIGCYFAFGVLDESKKLSAQWSNYINPFNNFFLYACGLALYYNFKDSKFNDMLSIGLIVVPLLIYAFYPVDVDQIYIATDYNRIIFALAAVAMTLGFYKLSINLPQVIAKPFSNLGEATYGIYLLHPIIYLVVNKIIANPVLCVILTCIATIITANISYKFYERPFIKLGKTTTARLAYQSNI